MGIKKIFRIAPIALSIKKNLKYGGIERGISFIDTELTNHGYKSIVAAPSSSEIDGTLYPTLEKSLWEQGLRKDSRKLEEHCNKSIDGILEYSPDIIHDHEATLVTSEAYRKRGEKNINEPILVTLHCNEQNSSTFKKLYNLERNNKIFFCILSESQRKLFPQKIHYVVYNGLFVNRFPLETSKKDYLFSLGSITETKGQDIAIEVARRTKSDLYIGGLVRLNVESVKNYWKNHVAPFIDEFYQNIKTKEIKKFIETKKKEGRGKIRFIGELDEEQKKEWFKYAKAFLMPIRWDEPFGRVVTEAMACGTPAIAFNRGAMPEIIENGKTGFVVNTLEEMIESLGKIDGISPYACRRIVEEKFTVKKQVDNYLNIYREIESKTRS